MENAYGNGGHLAQPLSRTRPGQSGGESPRQERIGTQDGTSARAQRLTVYRPFPRDSAFDGTLALLREGYRFLPARRERLGSDIFEGRLMLERTVFMTGAEAAELLYDNSRFARSGALPGRVKKTLTGSGGVQSLDDGAHRKRKAMFMALMGEESRAACLHHFQRHWQAAETQWRQQGDVCLFDASGRVLFQTACDWMGVPYEESDIAPCARHLAAMVDGFGGIGPRYWKGRFARMRMERWAMERIAALRAGRIPAEPDSGFARIARQTTLAQNLLPLRVAAVELLNILRPVTAIATYIAFTAHALAEHPRYRTQLRGGDAAFLRAFVQEVRRVYPFTPFVGARVRNAFDWRGHHFPQGRLVVLDIHGMNHDPRIWPSPQQFRPERFVRWHGDAYHFMPQGGGDHMRHHRCAGEWLTIDTMMEAARLLAQMEYTLPAQDMHIDLSRIPTRPHSGMLLLCNTNQKGEHHDFTRTKTSAPASGTPAGQDGPDGAGSCRLHEGLQSRGQA